MSQPNQIIDIPEFNTTNINDFKILVDGIDERLEIIRHETTGYFNITKITKLVYELKSIDGEYVLFKRARDWFKLIGTNALIDACCEFVNANNVCYTLKSGTPTQFAGIYVHELLYDQFMQWLDPIYALKVSMLIKTNREYINDKMITERDSIIAEQKYLLDNFDMQEIDYTENDVCESDCDY